jgi:hypothetical protein
MKKANDDYIHLHYGWNDLEQVKRTPLHIISIGIAECGAKDLPRGRFLNDPETVTCPACLIKAKEKPKPPEQPPLSPPPPPQQQPVHGTPSGVIVALVKRNPRKQGTAKYDRMALLLKHDGQSVEAFTTAGGNITTLKNAIKENLVRVN